jgi:hypothetical protein
VAGSVPHHPDQAGPSDAPCITEEKCKGAEARRGGASYKPPAEQPHKRTTLNDTLLN